MMHSDKKTELLKVENLSVGFARGHSQIPVVHGVSFCVHYGETVALVGESGCGKSVTALALARLHASPPVVYSSGSIQFCGRDTLSMSPHELRSLRSQGIAYIFQDPATALNPVYRIGFQLVELLQGTRNQRREHAAHLLDKVGLASPSACLDAYPHELSGGMQQRVVIAMALARRPKLVVADEPTTALDVTIQAQIMALLNDLQKEFKMAILLITHNLGIVAELAHRLHIMYAGMLVETGPTERLLQHPAHPYTEALLKAVPRLDSGSERWVGIPGNVPSIDDRLPGCPFAPRCNRVQPRCRQTQPPILCVPGGEGHHVRCYDPVLEGDHV